MFSPAAALAFGILPDPMGSVMGIENDDEFMADREENTDDSCLERRRGKRVPLTFPVEVAGFDRVGRLFSERALTTDISEEGCRIRVRAPLERGDVVAIKLVSQPEGNHTANKPLLFQIAWVAREKEGWTVGALKLQPENIWHVAFPPQNRPKPSSK